MRISKMIAGEIRAGLKHAEYLFDLHGGDFTAPAMRELTSTDFSVANTGPYVRAARRRYARLVLRSRSAD